MSSRIVERAIGTDDGREIGVRSSGGRAGVVWFCGDRRSFNADDLGSTIRCLEALADHPDVWMEGKDSDGRAFFAQLRDGELYADTTAGLGASHVPWRPLRRALKKAVKT